ncbi:MAG: GAF domain-containing protein [Sphaerochaetaceae bacterium]
MMSKFEFEEFTSLILPTGCSWRHTISSLANAAAYIGERVSHVNWAGFYLVEGNSLLLGPFWGKVACSEIPFGKGVCGTAWKKQHTVVVNNVHLFPNHIVCDHQSNSEIVVPLIQEGEVVGVLDIDSPYVDRFSDIDRLFFEKVAQIISVMVPFT